MSSLLEEAIVDAKALKDAALKNAENTVLEKYSAEVKGALNTLLEQDELGLGGTPTEDSTAASADASFLDEVPYSFQNEDIDAPPADELIEIDFDALKTRIEEEEAAGAEVSSDDLTDALDMADALQEDGYITDTDLDNDAKEDVASIDSAHDDDVDIELTEEMIADLVEELVVDMTPRPQGWSSLNSADSSIEQANNDAMAAAQAAHLEEEEIEEEVATAP
jgi:hypothetical protein